MLHPVPVLVPTLHGRTSAQLYHETGNVRARLGALLVAMPGAWVSPVERVYDELALYLRSAGIVVLRLGGSADATTHATEILGSVSLLRSLGAGRVVLIAGGANDAALAAASHDAAFAGLLDLIATRAPSPRAYAQLICELVDTIRAAVDEVVGIARLVPRQPRLAPPTNDAAVLTVALPPQGEPSGTVDAIAELYTWAVPLLRSPGVDEARRGPSVSDPPANGEGESRALAVREAIWRELERAWHEVVVGLEERAPERAQCIRALAARDRSASSPTSTYGQAWVHLDKQARRDWIAACMRVFPLRIA